MHHLTLCPSAPGQSPARKGAGDDTNRIWTGHCSWHLRPRSRPGSTSPKAWGRGSSPHPSGLYLFLSILSVSGRRGGVNWALQLSSDSTIQVFYNFLILPGARKTKPTLPLLLINPPSFHPGYPSSPSKVLGPALICGPWGSPSMVSGLSLLGHMDESHCPGPRAGQRVWPGEPSSLGRGVEGGEMSMHPS